MRVQSEFRVEVRDRAGATVIAIAGELDLASSPVLQQEIDRVLQSGVPEVILDLRELDFMDSTGLSVLVRVHHASERAAVRFCLVKGPPQVQRLLTLTGVAERFTLLDELEDAPQSG
jgi:anti-anti-sigma factor